MKNARFSIYLTIAIAIACAAAAMAEEFPQAKAIQQISVTRGFAQSALPVLKRMAGPSQASVGAALLKAICSACPVTTQMQGSSLQISSERLSLSISADGTTADFRDLTVEARSHAPAKRGTEKMSAEALEKAGQAFIEAKLSGSIVLGPNEALIPLLTDHRVEGLPNVSTGEVTRSVVANRVVFGRTLNGVLVVGNGSIVVVTFANDGAVEAFHYDWPRYEPVGSQTLATPSTLLVRIQQAVSAHSGVAPAFTPNVPNEGDAASPVSLNTGTKLQSMECGYYDAGDVAALASVQPGCVYRAVYEDVNGIPQGYVGAVPGVFNSRLIRIGWKHAFCGKPAGIDSLW